MAEEIRALEIVHLFNAPRARVFEAWTNPEILAQWWGPNGVTNPVCKLDLRPGGTIEIVMLAGDSLGVLKGTEWPMKGIFQEIISPSKLVYTSSAVVDGEPLFDCLNTITFEEDGNQTKMTLKVKVTRMTPAADGPLSGMQIGWSQSIDKLDVLIKA
jgi:uncharacterized protein YndB with AHSA1/START domain